MDRAPALCIVGDLGVIRNAFSASLSRSTNGLLGSQSSSMWATGQPPRVKLCRNFNRSECTRGSEMRGAYLAVSHTARGDGETDSAMRTYVPQPSAIAPARYHASYCALRAEARFGGCAKHGECARHRRPCPPARCPSDSAADHAALGAAECHRARVEPGFLGFLENHSEVSQ